MYLPKPRTRDVFEGNVKDGRLTYGTGQLHRVHCPIELTPSYETHVAIFLDLQLLRIRDDGALR